MQQENKKLTDNEILELETNYISISESEYITLLLKMVEQHMKKEDYLYSEDSEANEDFEKLYCEAKMMNPAALPYSNLTTIVFHKKNDDELSPFLNFLETEYKKKYNRLKEQKKLHKTDGIAISTIAKTVEHLNLAVTQKENLLNEQVKKIKGLKENLKELTTELEKSKNVIAEQQGELKIYSSKYERMTMDYLSMMGIFSTIIFAVFGGLSQIGSLGSKLHLIPIHKILMYVSVTSLTLLLLVFLCFNAISSMTKYNLKSCGHQDKCTCGINEKHPTVWFGIVFFVELFLFSIVLRTLNYYEMTEKFGERFNHLFGLFIAFLFLLGNVIFYVRINNNQN